MTDAASSSNQAPYKAEKRTWLIVMLEVLPLCPVIWSFSAGEEEDGDGEANSGRTLLGELCARGATCTTCCS